MSVYSSPNDSVPTPRPGAPIAGDSVPTPVPLPNGTIGTADQLKNWPVEPQAPTYGNADPNQNPSYLAFLRSMGMNESQVKAQVARQQGALQAQLEAQRPVWAQTLTQGLEGVMNNAAGRGTVRSSNRLMNQALTTQGVNRQQAAYEGNIANQQQSLSDQLQSTLLNLQRQKAEQAAQAQQAAYQENVGKYQNDLTNYYLQTLLQGGANG
jgi:hypothetical protein